MKRNRILPLAFVCLAGCATAPKESAPVAAQTPVVIAARLARDFELKGDLSHRNWKRAKPVALHRETKDARERLEIAGSVRLLWSSDFLYLGYSSRFTGLTVFDPPNFKTERIGLWNRDVVETFIGSDWQDIKRYLEFQVAPTNEKLDLTLNLPERDFAWSSGFQTAVQVDEARKVWTAEMKIPLSAWNAAVVKGGARWRINLFRCDYANKAFLAWNPTGNGSFHTPEKFGVLEFGK
jgi:hypothetical protein